LADFQGDIRLGEPVLRITRTDGGVAIRTGHSDHRFDAVVIATHADQALGLLADADSDERRRLGAFRYAANRAVLHRDASAMPRRRRLWSSWNYLGTGNGRETHLSVSYWMNRLQPLGSEAGDLFVTLNPASPISDAQTVATFDYAHPMFDVAAMAAQRTLWELQGRRRTWFCGSYFGYGFHEDGLQSGLAAAEALGGVRRPWTVENESGRIHVTARAPRLPEAAE
jgi:predicted NAD/FAD-binding protein